MESNHSLSIYFGKDYANLYTVGYVSTDIFQVLTFCELVQKGDKASMIKYFNAESFRPFPYSRYSSIYKKNIKMSEISDVKKGSVELIIQEVTLAATIIIPLVVLLIQEQLYQRRERLTFNVNPNDIGLRNLIRLYELGEFGHGIEGLNEFFRELGRNNYNVGAIAQNVYNIDPVINIYARRIARTLRMN